MKVRCKKDCYDCEEVVKLYVAGETYEFDNRFKRWLHRKQTDQPDWSFDEHFSFMLHIKDWADNHGTMLRQELEEIAKRRACCMAARQKCSCFITKCVVKTKRKDN